MIRSRRALPVAWLLAVVPVAALTHLIAGCGGSNLDLGDDDGGPGGPASSDGSGAATGDDAAASSEQVWSGYAENYAFPSGSDSIVLTMSVADDGSFAGHANFGGLPPFPPATDPNVGYPYAEDKDEPNPELGELTLEGFSFTLRGGKLSSTRLQTSVWQDELFTGWCALQTPYVIATNNGDATEYGPGPFPWTETADGQCVVLLPDAGDGQTINCARAQLCNLGGPCTCTSTSCSVRMLTTTEPGNVTFDLNVNGSHADGSAMLPGVNGYTTVHLLRQ